MADESERNVLSEAAQLLTKAAALLTETGNSSSRDRQNTTPTLPVENNRSGTLENTQSGTSRSGPAANVISTTPTSGWQDRADRAVQNFRNLFGGLPSKTTQQSAGGRPKPANSGAKRVFNAKTGTYFWKRETWTHRFVCLAHKDQIYAPSREEKESLRVAGLGEKKLVLNKGLCALDVMSELIKAYPKLAEGGGFELLRSGNRLRDLVLITAPPGGYSVSFLKDSGIGQSIIYIRPIQTDLDLDPIAINMEKSDDELVQFYIYCNTFLLCDIVSFYNEAADSSCTHCLCGYNAPCLHFNCLCEL